MKTLLLAGAILAAAAKGWAVDIPQTVDQAMQQIERNAKESQDNTRYWIDKHQKDDTNDRLRDIEDAIIINGEESE